MVLGLRNVVGTSALAKEEANEAQTQQNKKKIESNIHHSNIYKNSNSKNMFFRMCVLFMCKEITF